MDIHELQELITIIEKEDRPEDNKAILELYHRRMRQELLPSISKGIEKLQDKFSYRMFQINQHDKHTFVFRTFLNK